MYSHIIKRLVSSNYSSKATAAGAGRERWLEEWTSARGKAVRLEALVHHYKSLGEAGCSSPQDMKIASDRTRRHLSGPSGSAEIRNLNGEELEVNKCWIDPLEVKIVNQATLRSLRGGLKQARLDVAI